MSSKDNQKRRAQQQQGQRVQVQATGPFGAKGHVPVHVPPQQAQFPRGRQGQDPRMRHQSPMETLPSTVPLRFPPRKMPLPLMGGEEFLPPPPPPGLDMNPGSSAMQIRGRQLPPSLVLELEFGIRGFGVGKISSPLRLFPPPNSNCPPPLMSNLWHYHEPTTGQDKGPFNTGTMGNWQRTGYLKDAFLVRRATDLLYITLANLKLIYGDFPFDNPGLLSPPHLQPLNHSELETVIEQQRALKQKRYVHPLQQQGNNFRPPPPPPMPPWPMFPPPAIPLPLHHMRTVPAATGPMPTMEPTPAVVAANKVVTELVEQYINYKAQQSQNQNNLSTSAQQQQRGAASSSQQWPLELSQRNLHNFNINMTLGKSNVITFPELIWNFEEPCSDTYEEPLQVMIRAMNSVLNPVPRNQNQDEDQNANVNMNQNLHQDLTHELNLSLDQNQSQGVNMNLDQTQNQNLDLNLNLNFNENQNLDQIQNVFDVPQGPEQSGLGLFNNDELEMAAARVGECATAPPVVADWTINPSLDPDLRPFNEAYPGLYKIWESPAPEDMAMD